MLWDRVYAVYTAGQWDLAVEGFQSYIRTFPTSPQADDAQLYIGHALYSAGKYPEAVTALQRVISTYPQSDSVPTATTSWVDVRSDEAVRCRAQGVRGRDQELPRGVDATLAQQGLVRVQDKKH